MQCRDKNNVVNHFMRRYLVKHVNDYCPNLVTKCKYCSLEDTLANIVDVHAKVCPMTPLSCPNSGCHNIIKREALKRHLADCEHAQVACKYVRLGCNARVKKDMPTHVQDATLHLQLALDSTEQLQTTNKSLAKKVEKLESKAKTCFTFKMWNFENKKDIDRVYTSYPFYTSPNGYNLAIEIHTNGCGKGLGTHLSVFVKLRKGRNDYDLMWPFEGKVTITLLNQLEDEYHFSRTIQILAKSNIDVGSAYGYETFFEHAKLLYDPANTRTQYLKGDTLFFRVSADDCGDKPWLGCTDTSSCRCSD